MNKCRVRCRVQATLLFRRLGRDEPHVWPSDRFADRFGVSGIVLVPLQMNAETLKPAVEDLVAKVVGGKALEAFDRYYADDVSMQENEQPPRVGKAACRAFEADFLSKIKAVRTYVCDGYVISGNKASLFTASMPIMPTGAQ